MIPKSEVKFSQEGKYPRYGEQMVSDIVAYIKDSSLPKENSNNLLHAIRTYREKQYEAYESYFGDVQDFEEVDFATALAYREETSIPVMRIWAQSLNAFFPAVGEDAVKIEEMFADLGMVWQFEDDFRDWKEDRGKTFNLLDSALNRHPNEKELIYKATLDSTLTVDMLRELAPKSYTLFSESRKSFRDKLASIDHPRVGLLVDFVDRGFSF